MKTFVFSTVALLCCAFDAQNQMWDRGGWIGAKLVKAHGLLIGFLHCA